MSPRILVVGSLNCDVVVRVPALPRPGETVLGLGVVRAPGGKGGNQAVAARRLGADVAFVGAVGDDPNGTDLLRWLAAEGVDTTRVATIAGVPSGTALIDVQPDGENMITVVPGANHALTHAHLAPHREALAAADMVLLQLEIPLDVAAAAVRTAREAGVPVLLNAAPRPVPADLRGLVADVTALVVNESEAAALGAADPAELARAGVGAGLAVVTRGVAGASWAYPDGSSGHLPGFVVQAVDTVGAGDTFCAALALGLCAALPPAGAVRRACAAAALATTRSGAQSAMPTAAELDAFLAGHG